MIAIASGSGAAWADSWIDEAKVGLLAHDVSILGHHIEDGPDINGEILFTSPSFLQAIWSPRPHIGGSVNVKGNTDYGYFGLTWSGTVLHDVIQAQDGIFIAGSLGGAFQDGYGDSAPAGRKKLGMPFLFRESIEVGYQITPAYNISVMMDHLSNAGIAKHNQGLNEIGVRTGFKF